jgi:hypothetical protein
MSLPDSEFVVLRQTIATRGTTRVVLLPVTLISWAVLTVSLPVFGVLPYAIALPLFPLAILAGGFEAIHALHVGVERIGRYLQVYYEGVLDGPRWETTAMAVGPALPGGGIDPLFAMLFSCATVLNVVPALMVRPTLWQIAVIVPLHLAFLVRIVRARGAAARQRAVDLETFKALKAGQAEPKA